MQDTIGGADGIFDASGTTWNVFSRSGGGDDVITRGAPRDTLSRF